MQRSSEVEQGFTSLLTGTMTAARCGQSHGIAAPGFKAGPGQLVWSQELFGQPALLAWCSSQALLKMHSSVNICCQPGSATPLLSMQLSCSLHSPDNIDFCNPRDSPASLLSQGETSVGFNIESSHQKTDDRTAQWLIGYSHYLQLTQGLMHLSEP